MRRKGPSRDGSVLTLQGAAAGARLFERSGTEEIASGVDLSRLLDVKATFA